MSKRWPWKWNLNRTIQLYNRHAVTQSQFLNTVRLIWIQKSSSNKSVTDPKMYPITPTILPRAEVEVRWFHTVSKSLSARWKANNLDHDLNLVHLIHFITTNATRRKERVQKLNNGTLTEWR